MMCLKVSKLIEATTLVYHPGGKEDQDFDMFRTYTDENGDQYSVHVHVVITKREEDI